ncbi:MAG TPA: hypothetical protein VD927_00150 [Chryseosolibacter sp.]|nr:hypothetical protein [Chryseosolibacter sp.]
MKKLVLLFSLCIVFAESMGQFDPMTIPMVYHEPAMDKVSVQEDIAFKTVNADTVLKVDIYYPPGYDKKTVLPAVIFTNGVGSMQIPDWKIYQDWARLIAANGMIAVNYQSRFRKTDEDLADVVAFVRGQRRFNIDKENLALWACSGNTPPAMAFANNIQHNFIRALTIYYGFLPPHERKVKRRDLEIQLVRAGLDSHNINIGMEELMIDALQRDAHVEYVSYPEGQHAFDGVDHTPRSKEIILQTVDFFKRNLLGNNDEAKSTLVSNRGFWDLVLREQRVDEALAEFQKTFELHNSKPVRYPFWNQILNENNLNAVGYQLLNDNRPEDAIKIFALNAEKFPASPNVYDALADGYEKCGDTASMRVNANLALDKLKDASGISPQFAQAIRASAETKLSKLIRETSPHRRAHHELVYDGNTKRVLLVGGSTPLNGGQSFRFFNDVWQFDGAGWTKLAEAGDERSGIRTAFNKKDNKLYSFGGFTKDNKTSGQLRSFENNEWKVLADVAAMKAAEAGFVYDEARDVLIAFTGSSDPASTEGITWEWSVGKWKRFSGANPPARQAAVMVYDPKRKRTVLYGGMGSNQQKLDDLWEFDGKKWNQIAVNGPGARMASGAAFDPLSGMVMLFGGASDEGIKGDTWGWNGKVWKKLSDNGPAPRMMGYMAYDETRKRMVLFGGRVGWPNDLADTWEWDGRAWSEVK